MSKTEKENIINSLAVTFLERQQIKPNPLADQIIRAYKEGYSQAEKDLELTWEDIQKIDVLIYAVLDEEKYKRYYTQDRDGDFYEEVFKRFKDFKERKEK